MKKYPALLLSLALVLCFFACKKDNAKSEAPTISLQGMSQDSVINGASDDTVILQIYIKDNNGDLASDAESFYMKDPRDTLGFIAYTFPIIDEAILNNPRGIEGQIYFFITGALAVVRDDSLHQAVGDTVQYEIYVKDVAGQESNHITTAPIYIKTP